MPTYLIHGFRWERHSIRVHIVLNDLEDAAPEWVIAPATSVTLLNSFYTLFDFLPPSNPPPASYPLPATAEVDDVLVQDSGEEDKGPRKLTKVNKKASIGSLRELVRRSRQGSLGGMGKGEGNGSAVTETIVEGKRVDGGERTSPSTATSSSGKTGWSAPGIGEKEKKPGFNDWSVVKLVEQHDPEHLSCTSQPHAYVADYMIEIPLSASVTEEMARYEARAKEEEAELSQPGTPGLGHGKSGSVGGGGSTTPPLSAREIRRKNRRLGWFEKLRDALQKNEEIGWYVVVCGDEERVFPAIAEEEGEEEEESSDGDETVKSPRSAGLRGFFGKKKDVVKE